MDALLLVTFFVALAVASQIWGYDSRDGFTSGEYARRQAWLTGPSDLSARKTASVVRLAARVAPRAVIGDTTDVDAAGRAAAYSGARLAVASE